MDSGASSRASLTAFTVPVTGLKTSETAFTDSTSPRASPQVRASPTSAG